ncbi:MAG: DUF3256 family protein [Prevotella sp.]|nr:DUF3256 family protein [Prevotella sp.]
MKKAVVLVCFLACWLGVSAQDMRQIWIDMPDSIVPYLNKSLRTELADYANMKVKAEVKNLLGDTTRIEKLTDSYLSVTLNGSSCLEIRILDKSAVALVQTWKGPEAESRLSVYSLAWEQLPVTIDGRINIVRPDSVDQKEYDDLRLLMKPYLTELHLSADDNSLSINYNFPLLSMKERGRVAILLKPRTLRWTGKAFR